MNVIRVRSLAVPFHRGLLAIAICPLLLGISASLSAQTTGSISGTVTDQTQSMLPKVTVEVKQDSTGITEKVTTNQHGLYAVPLLAPGTYVLRFTLSGFESVVVRSRVVVSEVTPVNVTMHVGSVSQQVTVNDENAAVLQTSTTSLGRVVGERQVQDLPLSTRNFTQLMTLSPGAASLVNDATAAGRGTQTIYDNGARATSNSLTIDGIDADNIHTNSLAQNSEASNGVSIPSPEAIQEFKVQTGFFDAQYGRNAGANTSLVTRMGGEQYHGAAYEYLRNTDLDANTYFFRAADLPRAVLNQNQFGAVLGGPVPKLSKTFFFASYQGTRQLNGISGSETLTLPTGLYHSSRTASALGASYAGDTSAHGTLAVAANGSNINPVAIALLNYKLANGNYVIPSPQSTATTNNYSVSIPSTFKENGAVLNLDHQFGSRNTLSARSFMMDDPQFNSFSNANVPGFGLTQDFKSRGFNFSDVHIFSATIVNEARVGFLRTSGALSPQTVIPITSFGMNRFNVSTFDNLPKITVSGGQGTFEIGYSADANEADAANTFEYADTLAIIKGKHSLRVGGEVRRYQDNFYDYNYTLGAVTLYSFVDFLLGAPAGPIASGGNGGTSLGAVSSSIVSSTKALRNDRLTDYSLFIQDDYRMTRKLTLNLGFRWDRNGMAVDLGGRNGNFVPSLYTPPPSGGTTSAGFVQPSNANPLLSGMPTVSPTFLNHGFWKNFQPRVGLAYALSNKIAVHAGYGIFADRLSNQVSLRLALAPPNYFRSSLTAGEASGFSLANPFSASLPQEDQLPQIPKLYDPFTYPVTDLLAGEAVNPNLANPYMQQYIVNVQWQAHPDLLVEAGYVGSKGVKLPGQQYINQAPLASVSTPINGITTNTSANVDERVPFLGMSASGLTYLLDNEDSRYSSLQLSVTKTLGHGLQFLAAYTLSQSVDDASGGDTVFNTTSGDQDNVHQATGRSDFDMPSRFIISGLYNVPYLGNRLQRNAFTTGLLGGWQLGWITTAQSGMPFNITDSNGAVYYGTGTSRANYATGATSSTAKLGGSAISRLTKYFNTAAFVTAGNLYGNVPRNSLRGPGESNWDFSVVKNIPLVHETDFQFRTEFFNLFNHTNFGNPGSAVSSGSTFGVISSTVGNPRVVQFAGRLSF